jgi:hypothetical protein
MGNVAPDMDLRQVLREMLGYLNLSSGAPDPRFQRHANELFGWVSQHGDRSGADRSSGPPPQEMARLLREELAALRGTSAAFGNVAQAEAVIDLALDKVPAEYRRFHADLLFHRTDAELFRPFFLARVAEAVLQEGGPWDETDRIVSASIARLNDFIGHRPVAVLHNERMEPYPHEWARPIPLYLREAGIDGGPHQELIAKTLEILRATPTELLEVAYFDPELLDELAVDPRAYDFDHPVNKRVNYVFGQWDPHHIDGRGRYRRYVVTSVTFDALWNRVEAERELPRDELLYEAAAVLAGTLLMGAGVSGRGPETHDSGTTLASMLPRIAGLRDAFYEHLLKTAQGAHGERLRAEAKKRRQPFAGARQHLNQRLAYLRALQQQHVLLADIYARMGFPEASRRQISAVPVASARMKSEIHCRLTGAHLAIERGDLSSAMRQSREIEDFLNRAIDCGAIVDPWNMLGFTGHFSLFPATENSVRDHRVDQLIQMMEAIFALHARLQSEAAAVGNAELASAIAADMRKLAGWWDRFASTEVSDLAGFSGREATDSAQHVAESLGAWHRAGAAAGDVAFWRKYVASFSSPRAYAQVIAALIGKGDHAASMALMMQWLSQVDQAPLEAGEHSFHRLALRWMNTVRQSPHYTRQQRWELIRRFFDFLEANADDYWRPPTFAYAGRAAEGKDDTFAAAYEGMTYQDSTADGFEGEVFDGGGEPTEYELDEESQRINRRLAFLGAVAEMWTVATMTLEAELKQPAGPGSGAGGERPQRPASAAAVPAAPPQAPTTPAPTDEGFAQSGRATLQAWYAQAEAHWFGLTRLMEELHAYRVPEPPPSHDALVEFDRRLGVKEMLLENVMSTMVVMASAARTLLAVSGAEPSDDKLPAWERHAIDVRRAIAERNGKSAAKRMFKLLRALSKEPLLYVPLSRGGEPKKIVRARTLQALIAELLKALPRLGLWSSTCRLLEAAWEMETGHKVGRGAVSEFDWLFASGFQSLVESLVMCVNDWAATSKAAEQEEHFDAELIEFLNQLTEKLLRLWLRHSSTLRLSVLEGVDENDWKQIVNFIRAYGHDLFTPQFLNEGNLRAILHQGAKPFLEKLKELPDPKGAHKLIADLGHGISLPEAADRLELIMQAVVENDEEYNDYNHTTTQSDRGELLFCLLDFIRVKVSYERTAWKLTPVVLAHEVLVRRHRMASAELWRRGIVEQTSMVALQHLDRYTRLTEKYGMRLPTVADRLHERFVRPLDVDRIRALIKPAMAELKAGQPTRTFELLEQEIADFAATPSGVGLDVPQWLLALDEEVQRVQSQAQPELSHRNPDHLEWVRLTPQQLKRELDRWDAT